MSGRFDIRATTIAGLHIVERKILGDSRGYFERMYCASDLMDLAPGKSIVQINRTKTENKGAVRGLHFQRPPHAEIKYVSCLRGEVFDVAVDLRQGSPTFLHWHAEILSAEDHRTLVIPEGFAHGFQTLTESCELLYLHTAAYAPDAEGGLNPLDSRLAIHWPLPVTGLSDRDAAHAFLDGSFAGLNP